MYEFWMNFFKIWTFDISPPLSQLISNRRVDFDVIAAIPLRTLYTVPVSEVQVAPDQASKKHSCLLEVFAPPPWTLNQPGQTEHLEKQIWKRDMSFQVWKWVRGRPLATRVHSLPPQQGCASFSLPYRKVLHTNFGVSPTEPALGGFKGWKCWISDRSPGQNRRRRPQSSAPPGPLTRCSLIVSSFFLMISWF